MSVKALSETLRTALVMTLIVKASSASPPSIVSHCRKQLVPLVLLCLPSSEPSTTESMGTSGENRYFEPMPQPAFCAISEGSGVLAMPDELALPQFHSHSGMLVP